MLRGDGHLRGGTAGDCNRCHKVELCRTPEPGHRLRGSRTQCCRLQRCRGNHHHETATHSATDSDSVKPRLLVGLSPHQASQRARHDEDVPAEAVQKACDSACCWLHTVIANKRRICYASSMDEGRRRVIGIMAAILASMHMQTADDLFGTPQGSPRTDKLIDASIQWAERIMRKIDNVFSG